MVYTKTVVNNSRLLGIGEDVIQLKMAEMLIHDVNNGELIKKRSTPELTLFNLTIKCLSLMMKKLFKERQEYFKIYQVWLTITLIVCKCLPVCTIYIKQALTRYKRGRIISHEQPLFSFIYLLGVSTIGNLCMLTWLLQPLYWVQLPSQMLSEMFW
jgi:hypothetical protein